MRTVDKIKEWENNLEMHNQIAIDMKSALTFPSTSRIGKKDLILVLGHIKKSPKQSTTIDELKALEAWVSEKIGADSIKYNSLEDFVEALKIPKESLCLKCWDGNQLIIP